MSYQENGTAAEHCGKGAGKNDITAIKMGAV